MSNYEVFFSRKKNLIHVTCRLTRTVRAVMIKAILPPNENNKLTTSFVPKFYGYPISEAYSNIKKLDKPQYFTFSLYTVLFIISSMYLFFSSPFFLFIFFSLFRFCFYFVLISVGSNHYNDRSSFTLMNQQWIIYNYLN